MPTLRGTFPFKLLRCSTLTNASSTFLTLIVMQRICHSMCFTSYSSGTKLSWIVLSKERKRALWSDFVFFQKKMRSELTNLGQSLSKEDFEYWKKWNESYSFISPPVQQGVLCNVLIPSIFIKRKTHVQRLREIGRTLTEISVFQEPEMTRNLRLFVRTEFVYNCRRQM